jgi:Flp pilus assembly pilin Flp
VRSLARPHLMRRLFQTAKRPASRRDPDDAAKLESPPPFQIFYVLQGDAVCYNFFILMLRAGSGEFVRNFIWGEIKGLWTNQEGASLAEYGLLVALIAGIALVAVSATGTKLSTLFNSSASLLST